jgi:small-conductance mechanosensitive channel
MFDFLQTVDIDAVLQWVIPLCIVIVGVIIGGVIEWITIKTLLRLTKKTTFKWDDILVESARKIISGLVIIFSLWMAVEYAPLEDNAERFILPVLQALASFIVLLFLARLISGLSALALKGAGTNLASASLITLTIRLVILGIGVVFILQNTLNINIGPIFAALGIGGLAAALALQDTLSNLFSGVQIIATRQVRPGDYVKLESGELGFVTDVNWRNVKIQSHPDENMIIVPSSKLATTVMVNYNLPKSELMESVMVGVSYDSDLDHVEQVALDVARETVREVSGSDKFRDPQIRFREFNSSSIDFQVRLFLPKLKGRAVFKSEFIKRLHKRFNKEGINIPFPITTVYLNKGD